MNWWFIAGRQFITLMPVWMFLLSVLDCKQRSLPVCFCSRDVHQKQNEYPCIMMLWVMRPHLYKCAIICPSTSKQKLTNYIQLDKHCLIYLLIYLYLLICFICLFNSVRNSWFFMVHGCKLCVKSYKFQLMFPFVLILIRSNC